MLLSELARPITTQTHATVLKEAAGIELCTSQLTEQQIRQLLRRVQQEIRRVRLSEDYHSSHQNPRYLALLSTEKLLETRLLEWNALQDGDKLIVRGITYTYNAKKKTWQQPKNLSPTNPDKINPAKRKEIGDKTNRLITEFDNLWSKEVDSIKDKQERTKVLLSIDQAIDAAIANKTYSFAGNPQLKPIDSILGSAADPEEKKAMLIALREHLVVNKDASAELKKRIRTAFQNQYLKTLGSAAKALVTGVAGAVVGGLQGRSLGANQGRVDITQIGSLGKAGEDFRKRMAGAPASRADVPSWIGRYFKNPQYQEPAVRAALENYILGIWDKSAEQPKKIEHSNQAEKQFVEKTARELRQLKDEKTGAQLGNSPFSRLPASALEEIANELYYKIYINANHRAYAGEEAADEQD